MNGKSKKRIPKVLPVGLAMGILFSSAPMAEHKVKADVDTAATIITTLGSIYDAFGKESFTKFLEDANAKSSYNNFWENITYMAPTFKKGEFGITVFDYYKNQDFSQNIKIAYPSGKVEYKTIKHGQQLRIKEAGTIVDLTPDEPEKSKHDILYITQKQLDEGNTGVSLTNFKTYYLESDNSGRRNDLGYKFLKEHFPNAYHNDLKVPGVNEDELFKKLPGNKQVLGTSTSKTVGKEVLSKYVTNDPEATTDFKKREIDVFADTKLILETPFQSPYGVINGGASYQIIPYKKGTNKVFIKTGSKYLSGKGEGNKIQYSDSIGDDELFELVQIQPDLYSNKFQFHILNKNGVPLARNLYFESFTNPDSGSDDIIFSAKNNNEIHNWLREWYPGKENEKQKYDGVEVKDDEKDLTKWTAKDSSGNVIKNSWVNRGSDYYYAGSDGVFLKGWHDIEGKKYYFNPNDFGAVLSTSGSNGNHEIDGKHYHFNDKGALQQSAWRDGYYSDESGAFVKEGLREIDGKIYYFKDYKANKNEIRLEDQDIILHFSDKGVLERATRLNGELLGSITQVNLDEKQLMFEKDGSIRKSGVSKIFLPGLNLDGKEQPVLVYYSLEEGATYSGWKEVDGKKYHFEGGRHFTFDGNETIEGKKYYFNNDGEAILTGFVKKDGKTYYYDEKGVMQTGWQKINGKWHSFESSGEATVGKFTAWSRTSSQFGQYNFYAKDNGEIYVDETVYLPTKRGDKKHIFDSYGHLTIDWNS
ncbi:cell wall-binding protein [Bacillus sp. SBS7]|uniref:N-acetylmuramoyl-L-alanine amidase family protein n=1 Tax=Bacillus sp. SBS7 TaxID=3401756 RepID=UPI003AA9D28B